MNFMSRVVQQVRTLIARRAARERAARRRGVWRVEPLEPRALLVAGATPAPPPHGGNPVLEAEHEAVFALVADNLVTITAHGTGTWDTVNLWTDAAGNHRLPGNGDNVLV